VRELLDLLQRQGWRLIVIANGHGASNHRQVLDRLATEFTACSPARVVHEFVWVGLESTGHHVGHADAEETARLLALAPAAVDLAALPPLPEPLRNVDWAVVDGPTFNGDPAPNRTVRSDPRIGVSAERGEAGLAESVRHMVERVQALQMPSQ
jgi:creatinine amidohydrolase/Fe(II)-dependent formamide hydrolase-like protein